MDQLTFRDQRRCATEMLFVQIAFTAPCELSTVVVEKPPHVAKSSIMGAAKGLFANIQYAKV